MKFTYLQKYHVKRAMNQIIPKTQKNINYIIQKLKNNLRIIIYK